MIDKLSTSGFSVLNNTEMLTIDGGWNWGAVLGGAALVVACIGVTITTGGIGLCSVPLIIGAGTTAEIAVAAVAVAGSALGGAAMGYGATH
jgi:hypothetical protein